MSDYQDMMRHAREALSEGNARAFDGDSNFKKELVIRMAVVGPYQGEAGGLAFEVKVPRSAVNELGCTVYWNNVDGPTAARFLRDLAVILDDGDGGHRHEVRT